MVVDTSHPTRSKLLFLNEQQNAAFDTEFHGAEELEAKFLLLERLSEGKPFELTAPTLDGPNFDITQMKGKYVAVYYWASWNGQCVGDFAKLKLLLDRLRRQDSEQAHQPATKDRARR